jgi:regulatory protein
MEKRLTPQEALARMYRYCAYQERSHLEVKNKLYTFGLYKGEVEELITRLITEGFLNEERFAKAFAGGKFRMQKWGRIKILHELEARGLTKNCIKAGLREIDENDYRNTLQDLLHKKAAQIREEDPFIKRDQLARYAIQKGFEPELVWQLLKQHASGM